MSLDRQFLRFVPSISSNWLFARNLSRFGITAGFVAERDGWMLVSAATVHLSNDQHLIRCEFRQWY
jgi:hypothetical protein